MTTTDTWVAWLRSQVGTTENPPGSNDTPYGKHFGWDGVAWCAEFGWCSYDENGIVLPVKSAAVVVVYDFAEANGYLEWSTDPKVAVGDELMRTWTGHGRHDAGFDPEATHMQQIIGIRGSAIDLIGGNQNDPASGGVVSYDTVTRGDSSILGVAAWSRLFSTPHTGPVHAPTVTPPKLSPSHPNPRPLLYEGMPQVGQTQAWTRRYQNSLSHKGYPTIAQDGVFGPATDAVTRDFQKVNGLVVDGCVGMKTYHAAGLA